jgi:hypothetical protein
LTLFPHALVVDDDDGTPVHSLLHQSSHALLQLIFSVFKTLTDQQVTVELKNDLSITGVLKSVDQFRLLWLLSLRTLLMIEIKGS